MGEIIVRKVKGMNWMAKISLVLIFTMVFSTFMYQGFYQPKPAQAAVTNISVGTLTNGWAHPSTGTTGPYTVTNATFSCGAGSNRLLVAVVTAEASGNMTMAGGITATKGTGVNFTEAIGNASAFRGAWIGYLTESQINGNTNSISITNSTGTAWTGSDVYLACYSGVDQTTPIVAGGTGQAVATGNITSLTVNNIATVNTGMVIYGGDANSNSNSFTPPTGYTEAYDVAGTGYRTTVGFKAATATGTENVTLSWATSERGSFVVASLNPVSCTDSDAATLTTTAPTSSSTVSGSSYTIQTQVGTEATPSGMTGMAVTIAGSTGCNVTSQPMSWNAGTSRWEYNWNIAACGNPADTGISINVTGTDPDCATVVNAPAITNVTIDNTCSDGDPATAVTVTPATGSTVSDTVTVQGAITGEGTPGAGSATITITGSDTCNVAAQAMSWNAGTSKWEYSWNTAACGSVTPDTGVSVQVTYTDPDCAGATVVSSTSTNVTIDNTSLPSTITSCAGCHGYGATFNDGTARNTPEGQFQGSHKPHVADNNFVCSVCHVVPATETTADNAHRNGTIQFADPINGNTNARYSKASTAPYSFAQTNAVFTGGQCTNTSCHGSSSPTWGANTSDATCVKCHGIATSTPAQFTADTNRAAPGYTAASAPLGPGRSTGGQTAATDPKVGAHDAHLRGTDNYSDPIACDQCHSNVNFTSASFTNHMNGAGNLDWGALATSNSATPGYGSPNCTNTYCHFGASIHGYSPATANASVSWTNTTYLTGTPSLAGDCGKCHASPPSTTGTHAGITNINQCNTCHTHVNADGSFGNKSLHANGIVEALTSCIDCHASIQTGTHGTPRDAVVGEFGLAWGHRKTGRTAVADSDCIVCHLEGKYSAGVGSAIDWTSYHMDGNIDLRDPDGAGETPITDNSGGAFTFTKFLISYGAGSRTSAISNSIPDVISQKFCLACHDTDGATNPTARSNSGGTGTAAMPFGGVALGANYTAANDAIGTQGLIDVKKQFATTNSSAHPVRGPRNKDFPYSTRLAAPYNNIGTARDTNGTTGHTRTNSVVMNCFDCHTTGTALTNRTIVSHGNAVTLRGTTYVASPTLCLACHIGTYGGSTQNHGTGSAWAATGSSHGTGVMNPCHNCHGSNTGSTAPARPRPAQDYHGSNSLAGGGLWPTTNSKPYAFIRGWSGTAYHRPYRGIGELTTGSATCGAGTCPGGGQVGDGSNRTYTAGGTY